jgi:hypothetical protein
VRGTTAQGARLRLVAGNRSVGKHSLKTPSIKQPLLTSPLRRDEDDDLFRDLPRGGVEDDDEEDENNHLLRKYSSDSLIPKFAKGPAFPLGTQLPYWQAQMATNLVLVSRCADGKEIPRFEEGTTKTYEELADLGPCRIPCLDSLSAASLVDKLPEQLKA